MATTEILTLSMEMVSTPLSNSTEEIAGPSEDDKCANFLVALYVVILGIIAAFGLVGNSISFFVLRHEQRLSVATFLLCALAVTDNSYLTVTGLSLISSILFLYTKNHGRAEDYFKLVLFPLVYITQLITIWLTVLIAFNRYIAICKPFRAPMLCTMRRTKGLLAGILVFCLVYNIPRFLPQYLTENKLYKGYESVLYCLLYLVIPLLFLCYFNTCLIRELILIRQRQIKRQLPKTNDAEENNLTLVMVVIILVFIICQTPAAINQILYYTPINDYRCGHFYFYYYHLSNVIALTNSCVNFLIYCAVRQMFRTRVMDLFGCKHTSASVTSGETESMMLHNSCQSRLNGSKVVHELH